MRTIGKGFALGCGGLLALGVGIVVIAVIAGAAGGASGQNHAGSGANVFTVLVTAPGNFAGNIGVTDAGYQYQSQSVSGSQSGSWTVTGRSVSVTMQRQEGGAGTLDLSINGQHQRTTAPFGVVTLTAR